MIKRTFLFVLIILTCALMAAGCQLDKVSSGDKGDKTGSGVKPGSPILPTNNEIVEIHGQLKNLERLDLFVKNTQNGKKDKVRLTRYTIEGDPIFYDAEYDGSMVTITIDTTKDKFGVGEVKTYGCKGIQKQESNLETNYILEECPNFNELLTISHDIDKEDYFGFALKYGVGMKNKVDTKKMILEKDLQNGETVAVSDFQFSKEEMNKIYKLMILSNYLSEKKLSTKCNKKPYVSYDLTVWINGSSRHFQWTECDKSDDGLQMTNLVVNILDLLKHNQTYQSLPKVKGEYE